MNKDTSMAEGTPEFEAVDEPETTTDETLGERVVNITKDLDVEDFDFGEFIEGIRPARRAVRVTMRADLIAEMDRIVSEHSAASGPENTEQAEKALERFKALKRQVLDSQRLFIVEARADSRVDEIIEAMRKAGKPRPTKKATQAMWVEWNTELLLRRLVDAIVTPSNVTTAGLARLQEVAPSEFNLLAGAMQMVNSNPTEGISGGMPDFSRGL